MIVIPVGLLEVKQKCGGLLKAESPGVFLIFQCSPISSYQQLVNCSLNIPTSCWFQQQFLLPVAMILCSDSSCLSAFLWQRLSCHLNSLMHLKRVVDFQFVQPFSDCGNRSDDFMLFPWQTRNQKALSIWVYYIIVCHLFPISWSVCHIVKLKLAMVGENTIEIGKCYKGLICLVDCLELRNREKFNYVD